MDIVVIIKTDRCTQDSLVKTNGQNT